MGSNAEVHALDRSHVTEPTRNARHQASDSVDVTVVTRRPRAIVILLGWMGAEVGQLDEYVRIYHDFNCSTVVATAPALSIAVQKTTSLGHVATTACREAARLVRMAEMSEMGYGVVPLLVHVFGNGGALVLEQMNRLIREWVPDQDLENVQQQAQVSPCPVPMCRTLKPMESMKSLPSLTDTAGDSEEEEDTDDCTPTKALWTLPPQSRARSSSSLSLSSSPPIQSLSFRQCQSQEQKSFKHRHKSPKVKRIDMERIAAFSSSPSLPKYNMEDRAYQRDFSLVASRLYVGTAIFDSAPSYPSLATDLASVNKIRSYLLRTLVWSVVVARHGVGMLSEEQYYTLTVGGEVAKGRAQEFWDDMEQLSLTKRHVFVHDSSDITQQLTELMHSQKENGIRVKECKLQAWDPLERLRVYSECLESVLDDISKKTLGEDDQDGWSSEEEEEWHSARSVV